MLILSFFNLEVAVLNSSFRRGMDTERFFSLLEPAFTEVALKGEKGNYLKINGSKWTGDGARFATHTEEVIPFYILTLRSFQSLIPTGRKARGLFTFPTDQLKGQPLPKGDKTVVIGVIGVTTFDFQVFHFQPMVQVNE